MCNNSLIYLASPNPTSVIQGATLPLNTIVRRRGKLVQQSGESIILNGAGYYRVSISLTFTVPTAGVVSVAILQDGEQIQGATASTTITTANTEVRSLSFDCIARVRCNEQPSVLSFLNTGVAISSSNIIVNVEYLG